MTPDWLVLLIAFGVLEITCSVGAWLNKYSAVYPTLSFFDLWFANQIVVLGGTMLIALIIFI